MLCILFLVLQLPAYFYRSILFRAFTGLLPDIPTGCDAFCDYHDAVVSLSLICEFGQFEKFLLFRLLSQKSFLPQFSFTHILFGLLQCMYLLLFISSMCSFPSLGWETIEMLIVPWF